jgi:branched-chain amino acid transport system ATP-binding protein
LLRLIAKEVNEDARLPLEAADIRVHFGGVKAVDGVDLFLERGEILGLIGPNGAGKTTLVNALSGFQPLTHGTVSLGAEEITGLSPHRLAQRGLVRTFQGVRSFRQLTVLENVEVAGAASGLSRKRARAQALELLELVNLHERQGHLAESLSHGHERRLGLLRALAVRPRFLLLDEPSAGLDEEEANELIEMIGDAANARDCGVLVIEHNMRVVMSVCTRIHVLNYGRTLRIGSPDEVRSDADVVAAYLGTGEG